MAVIGAKGNFAGPGASFDDEADGGQQEMVCTQGGCTWEPSWCRG